MKTKAFWAMAACGTLSLAGSSAYAQETVVVEEQTVVTADLPCQTRYLSTAGDNWFVQLGAGITTPFVEKSLRSGKAKDHLTVAYNLGFGKWFSPYFGWRMGFNYAALHWDNNQYTKAKMGNANLDLMWDMFNSLSGVNSSRVFSMIPFVGVGGTFTWDYKPGDAPNIYRDNGRRRSTSWTLPVSTGMQMRFRLSRYVDFFAESRVQFMGDNFNNYAHGTPVDICISAIGGFTFNLGGSDFRTYNPCDYIGYINSLNSQVNDLRGTLAATAAALAAAEAQLPCPDVKPAPAPAPAAAAPLMATVRFAIDSSDISAEEMVNVYNIARWMKANPGQSVSIVGYADRDTGTAAYNMALSRRRAESVRRALVDKYGIDPGRLTIRAEGSDSQPYDVNNWNRIVIFSNAQ